MSIGICYTHKCAFIDDKWVDTEGIEPDDYVKKKKIKGTVSNELCPKCKKDKKCEKDKQINKEGDESSRRYQQSTIQTFIAAQR